ncbi:MAG TPA: PAS domain S-box protein [Candidatus Binataceae bacterium]|nr:PAS domain S-box protein [Candidatus Binataceae bacterium]
MSRSKRSLQTYEGRYLWVGFAIAIVAAAAVGLTAYNDISRNGEWIAWITHTGTVLETLNAAREDSFASVAALQTYFETGDRKNLNDFAVGIAELQRSCAALRVLTLDNASEQRRLDRIDRTGRRLASLAHNVTQIAPTMSREDVIKAPILADLSATLEQLRAQFVPMSAAEQQLLIDRTAKARTTSRESAIVMGLGGSVIFVWLLLVGGYTGLTTQRLKQATQALMINQEQLARVAERKKAEERFRALLESAPDSMVIVSEDRRIVLVNTRTEKLFGYARAELLGNPIEMLVPSRFRGRHAPQHSRQRADPEARATGTAVELSGLRKDGTEIPIEITLSLIETEDGTLVARAIRDISERKRIAEEMRLLNELEHRHAAQLEAANKELEAFSYSVSHDLRAPLRSIDGFGLALIEDHAGQLDAAAKALLDRIRAATKRMALLIDDLLNLARVTRSEMRYEVVDLSAMAKEVLAELQSEDPERRVECIVGEGAIGHGDPHLLRVVLENLLGNAWKFTMNKPQARIELGVAQQDGAAVYFVRDDGSGFDMTYVDKLFGTFQRLHAASEFPGTGIGLASVRRIIHRHGGRTWAEGAVGKGATFSFTLAEHEGGRTSA